MGIDATWNYLEVGHGKGPCDGIGGSIKRLADQAVKQGTSISDAHEFFKWARNLTSKTQFLFIPCKDYELKKGEIDKISENLIPVRQTLKIHAVKSSGEDSQVWCRDLSCYCMEPTCFENCGWRKETISDGRKCAVNSRQQRKRPAEVEKIPTEVISPKEIDLRIGDFIVIAIAGKKSVTDFHAGILEIDPENEEIHVSFLKRAKNGSYQMPTGKDSTWEPKKNVKSVLSKPKLNTAISTTNRLYYDF